MMRKRRRGEGEEGGREGEKGEGEGRRGAQGRARYSKSETEGVTRCGSVAMGDIWAGLCMYLIVFCCHRCFRLNDLEHMEVIGQGFYGSVYKVKRRCCSGVGGSDGMPWNGWEGQ